MPSYDGDLFAKAPTRSGLIGVDEPAVPPMSARSMIGAVPDTNWLNGCVAVDAKGFVKTGQVADGRTPISPYETSVPGIFAVGDVRANSVKRVASSVGEGSVVIHAIHGWLAGIATLDGAAGNT